MAKVETTQHEWVALSKEAVIVIRDDENNSVTIIGDPDAPPVTYYGCSRCDIPLEENGDNIFSPCEAEGA